MSLSAGNEALDDVIDEHGDHPLAVYARLVKGMNAQRDFKDLTADKELRSARRGRRRASTSCPPSRRPSVADEGVDNITLNMVMRTLLAPRPRRAGPR